jgi:hypothetical protein
MHGHKNLKFHSYFLFAVTSLSQAVLSVLALTGLTVLTLAVSVLLHPLRATIS